MELSLARIVLQIAWVLQYISSAIIILNFVLAIKELFSKIQPRIIWLRFILQLCVSLFSLFFILYTDWWAHAAWGIGWQWDPNETNTLIVFILSSAISIMMIPSPTLFNFKIGRLTALLILSIISIFGRQYYTSIRSGENSLLEYFKIHLGMIVLVIVVSVSIDIFLNYKRKMLPNKSVHTDAG